LNQWFPGAKIYRISALKRKGFTKLVHALKETAVSGGIPHEGEVLITRARHKNCIVRIIESIEKAEASLRKSMSQEFIVLDIRGALEALGEVTGQTVTDDILNKIFSDFCVGK